ncbi:repressor LexA [bacterium]|nr:repressor LexA [bacterium]|tara:strand:+ start:186 stop:809 length:624 start_codon:yes stop_codon:yes gene_type:complete
MSEKSNSLLGVPSKRQAEVLSFVQKYIKNNGFSPSMAEIAKALDISAPTAHQHVAALRKKNLLQAGGEGRRRSIQTYDKPSEIPLLGMIAAGGPIEAIRDSRPVEVPSSMIPSGSKYYALKVAGDSMIEDGIPDGSIVVIRDQQTADDGERVVAYMPDRNEVTLKRIYREDGKFKLVPSNKNLEPFYEDNVEVQGRVMGVISQEFNQ